MFPSIYAATAIETVSAGQIVHHESEDWVVVRSEQAPARPDLWTLTLIGPGATRRSGAYITKNRRGRVAVRTN
nr:MAG TPA: hypothetical protein [Caudoviricetes sp.]